MTRMRRNYELFFWLIVAAIAFTLFLFSTHASAAGPNLGQLIQTRQFSQTIHGHKYLCGSAQYTRGFAVECVLARKQPAKGAA